MAARPVFTFEGHRYHLGDLRVREVEALEVSLECRYVEIVPFASMKHKVAIMAVMLLRDRPQEDVEKIISDLTLDSVDKMWEMADDDMPEIYVDGVPDPKAAAAPSTPTSSSSPARDGSGLPTLPDDRHSETSN